MRYIPLNLLGSLVSGITILVFDSASYTVREVFLPMRLFISFACVVSYPIDLIGTLISLKSDQSS